MNPFQRIRQLGLILTIGLSGFLFPPGAAGQETDELVSDSIPIPSVIDTLEQNLETQTSDTTAVYLMRELENFGVLLKEIDRSLSRGFDSTGIQEKIREIKNDLDLIEQTLAGYDNRMDLRSMNTIQVVVEEIQFKVKQWQDEVNEYSERLVEYNSDISRFRTEVDWENLPADSILRSVFVLQVSDIVDKLDETDSRIRKELVTAVLLKREITAVNLQVETILEQLADAKERFTEHFLRPLHPPIWEASRADYPNDMSLITRSSFNATVGVTQYFLDSRWGVRILNIAIILFFYFQARYHLEKIRSQPDQDAKLAPIKFLDLYPLLSALVAGLTLAPFLYLNPPLFYMELLWLLLALLVSVFVWEAWPRSLYVYWLAVLAVFITYLLTNFLIDPTIAERWLILFLSAVSMIIGWRILPKLEAFKLPHPRLAERVVKMMIVLNAAAFLLNLFGYFTLAKTLGYIGVFGFVFGQTLWVFSQLVEELLFVQKQSGVESRFGAWIHFQNIQEWLGRGLFYFSILLWVIGIAKILNLYDLFYDSISNFLSEERKIGDAVFTFGSLLVFVLIIYATTVISKLINFILEYQSQPSETTNSKKKGLGNFAVLIRIGLLSVGFLIGLSAAGIPLDRIAIVVGALGVGIGFGLQTIVNNLVSGIILAFERPIQIGDLIEVGTMIGTVKEIGIRASKITTFDGAELIIPNGDLLSQQVINWTLHDRNRRIELIIGVGYGSDIKQVREVIEGVLSEHSQVMSYPNPMILVHNFSDSSVDFRLLFWTYDISQWISVKSDILSSIYEALYEAEIEIPFPKRDVFVHFPEGNQSIQEAEAQKGLETDEKEGVEKNGQDEKETGA